MLKNRHHSIELAIPKKEIRVISVDKFYNYLSSYKF